MTVRSPDAGLPADVRTRFPRATATLEWLVLAVLAWLLVDWGLSLGESLHSVDFAVYYSGAWQLAHRLNIYGGPPGLIPYGGPFEINAADGNYNYPPWLALLVAPLTALGWSQAAWVWLVLNVSFGAACLRLSLRLCRLDVGARRALLLFAALLLWRPTVDLLLYGQATLLVGAAGLLAVWLIHAGRPGAAGVAALVAASKPQATVLLLLGLALWECRRRRFAFVASAAASAVVACIGCAVMAPGWPTGLVQFSAAVHDYWSYYVTTRILLSFLLGQGALTDVVYGMVALVATVALVDLWWRADEPVVYPAAITLAATPLIVPLFNMYDYVILVLPLLLTMATLAAHGQRRAYGPVVGLLVAAGLTMSADQWLVHAMNPVPVWTALQGWLGDEGTNRLWTHLKWDTRLLALLLPATVLKFLLTQRARATAILGAGPAAAASEAE